MEISDCIQYANIGAATGIISNSLLIYLVLRFSKKNIGTYKYLLIIFASYDLFLTLIHAIIEPKIYDFGTIFTIHSKRYPDNNWLCVIYTSCFSVPFALTNINFLHRYWAVKKFDNIIGLLAEKICRPANLALFSNPIFVQFISMYPIGQCITWLLFSFQTDIDESHFVRDHFINNLKENVTGFRVMHHWKDDRLNISQFMVVIDASFVMTINFSIAIFLASQTIAEIRKAKTFSSNFRTLQIKILQALFAQTAVPVLFVYIPFGCAILFPFFKIDDTFHLANSCMTFTSFFPAWDAIVVILLMKDYRDGLLSLFVSPQNTSSIGTTVWKTQMTKTSFRLE